MPRVSGQIWTIEFISDHDDHEIMQPQERCPTTLLLTVELGLTPKRLKKLVITCQKKKSEANFEREVACDPDFRSSDLREGHDLKLEG